MTPIIAKLSRDRREESGSIMLYALFAVILLSSLAFLTTTLTPNTTSAALDLKKYIESLNTEVGELPDEELPEIVVDYGSVIDAGFIQAAEAAGMNPIDYILAYWQWSDPWYILDSDGNKHYFLIDNPKDVAGGCGLGLSGATRLLQSQSAPHGRHGPSFGFRARLSVEGVRALERERTKSEGISSVSHSDVAAQKLRSV